MDSSLEAILGPDPKPLETLILDLIQTTNNKQRSQAESPPHLHNNNTHKLIHTMSSSSSMDHQISEILGPDPEPFKTLISPTMTPSNEQHSEAESLFNLCKQTNPKKLAEKLVQLIEHSPRLDVRAMSAILLPNTLLQKPSEFRPSLWYSSFELRLCVKSGLLNCARNEQNKPIIIILGNTISKLTADKPFPDLIPFMFDGFKNVGWLKESALLIFAQLGEQYVKGYLVHHQTYLHGVFKDCLENGDIRITALSAVIKFIRCLTRTNMLSFKDLLPNMLKCVTEASNEATAQKVLLIELAGTWPSFFTEKWPVILMIATENSEEGTGHWAIELVITSAVSNNNDLPLPQPIINSLCEILIRMLLDIEDEAAWHSAENEDEDAGRSSNYIFGKQCLHRLVTAHPCVSLAAIGQLSADLDPDLQVKYNSHVLPTLAKILAEAMCEVPDPPVRLDAMKAIVQLCAGLDPDLQFEYNSHVLPTLAEAMCEDPDFLLRLVAIDVTVQLFANLDPDLPLTDDHHESVLYALHGAICEFKYLLVQDRAVDAMINISMNYPLVTPRYLCVTVGTLLELRHQEDIALDQTRIRAIRYTLKAFEEKLPRDTWTSTFNRLLPEQKREFRSIREDRPIVRFY